VVKTEGLTALERGILGRYVFKLSIHVIQYRESYQGAWKFHFLKFKEFSTFPE